MIKFVKRLSELKLSSTGVAITFVVWWVGLGMAADAMILTLSRPDMYFSPPFELLSHLCWPVSVEIGVLFAIIILIKDISLSKITKYKVNLLLWMLMLAVAIPIYLQLYFCNHNFGNILNTSKMNQMRGNNTSSNSTIIDVRF